MLSERKKSTKKVKSNTVTTKRAKKALRQKQRHVLWWLWITFETRSSIIQLWQKRTKMVALDGLNKLCATATTNIQTMAIEVTVGPPQITINRGFHDRPGPAAKDCSDGSDPPVPRSAARCSRCAPTPPELRSKTDQQTPLI